MLPCSWAFGDHVNRVDILGSPTELILVVLTPAWGQKLGSISLEFCLRALNLILWPLWTSSWLYPISMPLSLGLPPWGVSIVGSLPIPLGQIVFSWTFTVWRLLTLSFQNVPTHVFQAFHKWSMLFLAMSSTYPLPLAFCPRLEVDPNLHII